MDETIKYPYLPENRLISYVPQSNEFMKIARSFARKNSLDETMPGASVIVKADRLIGIGVNGSYYHKNHGCRRVELNCKTGEDYELCEGCHPKNHSEAQALALAKINGEDANGADLYLWGHWWCCKPCWDKMLEIGIKKVFLVENSENMFGR